MPPSEISPDFFLFVGSDEVDNPETSAGGAASPEFSFRFFCLRLSACERTGSSGTVSPSRAGESSASEPESDAEDAEREVDGDDDDDDDDEVSDSTGSVEISASLRFALPDAKGFLRVDMTEGDRQKFPTIATPIKPRSGPEPLRDGVSWEYETPCLFHAPSMRR